MQNRAACASSISRRAFKDLVILWLTIVFFTFTAALLLSTTKARADALVLPLPSFERVTEPAIIKPFSVSPSPVLVGVRCQTLLNPIQSSAFTDNPLADRNRRSAGTSVASAIEAIRSYRHCSNQVALENLNLTTALNH